MQVSNVKCVSFKGMAFRLPYRFINNAEDAIAQWNLLRHPQYTNIFQETEEASLRAIQENKAIRDANYSFLDKLQDSNEKAKFVEYFKQVTGFPVLETIAKKMVDEFHRVLDVAIRRMGGSPDDIVITGYDKFCSVKLGTALPGSDLDKGYAIVKGVGGDLYSQKTYSNRFKGEIWDNIDNRVMSVNHCAAFPNIMTDKELMISLTNLEKLSSSIVGTQNRYFLFLQERIRNGNPVSSAKFNIWLSEALDSKEQKIDAKNLAYVVEAIRDGARGKCNKNLMEKLFDFFEGSTFVACTNVAQGATMFQKYDAARDIITKPKLKARKIVEKEFNAWGIDKQYELVKDVIRSMSGDNKNPEFNQLFFSKTDKHRLLINDILKGDVSCGFQFYPGGGERIHLIYNTVQAAKRYFGFDVYKMDY